MEKKGPRKPLARNEPLRKSKPAPQPPAVNAPEQMGKAVRVPVHDTTRVYRPAPPAAVHPLDVEVGHRKLIRTTLEDVRRRQAEGKLHLSEKATSSFAPPRALEVTNMEAEYLTTLIQAKAPVVVKLMNGEQLQGWIEYMDKNLIRLTRENQPNLFIYKQDIRYLEAIQPLQKPASL